MEKNVYIHGISTRVPECSYTQEFALEYQLKLIGDEYKKRAFLKKIYADTMIRKRHTVIDDYGKAPADHTFYPKNESLEPEPTTKQRNDLYASESKRLSLECARALLSRFPDGFKDKITHLVTVSCTGFSAPGFDFHLMKRLGLRRNAERYHIGFMGCYAAFPAMKLASNICRSDPGARVMIVCVELCSLHYRKKFDPDSVVANAIFADGASAALVSAVRDDSERPRIALKSFRSAYADDSEEEMAWSVGTNGFDMKLSYYVPKIIDSNIGPVADLLFSQAGVRREDIAYWAVHPGGKAILEKFRTAFNLTADDLRFSYGVLSDYGNMSSSTILFVLDGILGHEGKNGLIFSAGFGPGLTIETALMEKTDD